MRLAFAAVGHVGAMTDPRVTSVPLEDEEGQTYRVAQQNIGQGDTRGGGEWPDPDAPAQAPAPGAVEEEPVQE